MANPSTGFGGAGTEVLRRGYVDGMTNSEATLLTGVANHIYTVLSVTFSERNNASALLNMFCDIDGGGTDIHLLTQEPNSGFGTFVFNDKFVLTGTDELNVSLQASGAVDVYISYIDQDWT